MNANTVMHRFTTLIGALLLASPAWSQAVPSREPTSTHIFPAGGQRGTVVKVRVGGECFPPGMNFQLLGKGVDGPKLLGPEIKPPYEPSVRRPPRDADGVGANMAYPREWDATLTLAADAGPGPRYWRAFGAFGGTRLRPFLVGDLPEFIETESNSMPERAERVTLPVVLNGQIAGERDQDFYLFSAKKGDVVVADVMAARIGSPLDPVISISANSGRRLEVDEVRVGGDPVVAFRAPADGDYRLHVANLSFFGGPAYVYRITLSTRPYAAFAFPPGGRAGDTRVVETFTLTGEGGYRIAKQRIDFPKKAGPFELANGLHLIASDQPEACDSAGNHTFKAALELTTPVTVNGRFLNAQDENWYRFTAKAGQAYAITCQPFPAHSLAVPILELVDSAGATLAKGHGVETPDHAIYLNWIAPKDEAYRLRLRDLQHGSRGGPEFIYRLDLRPSQPDFALRLAEDYLNVVQGGKTELDLIVGRRGGFHGPIDLTARGLPEGVKLETPRVPEGQTRIKILFSAKEDTRPLHQAVTLTGKATIGKNSVERKATANRFGQEGESLNLTVQHKPLFRITCNEAYQYAHRGSIYPYLMQVERLHGFNGPITLQLCDRQVQDLDGIEMVETVIPPGAKEAENLIYLPETMHTSVQHHCRPYAQGYATFTDKWGQKQTLLAVCDKRCMIRTMPPVAKLRAASDKVVARPGETIACKLILDRTSNFTAAAEVELIEPAGFKAEKTRIDAGASEAVLRVLVKDISELPLRFRATGRLANGATVVSEAMVAVEIQ